MLAGVAVSLMILAFAFGYAVVPAIQVLAEGHPISVFGICLYVSVLSLTNMGYARIVPYTDVGFTLSAIEGLMGYVMLAVFASLFYSTLKGPRGRRERRGDEQHAEPQGADHENQRARCGNSSPSDAWTRKRAWDRQKRGGQSARVRSCDHACRARTTPLQHTPDRRFPSQEPPGDVAVQDLTLSPETGSPT